MRIALGIVISLIAASAVAQVYVDGYTRRDGTYVAPHYRSSPNSTRLDNYSTQGNYNPYSGRAGAVNPYTPPSPPTYAPQPYNYGTPAPYQPYRY